MTEPSPTISGYSTLSRLLHWLTALVVLATIPVGVVMTTEGLSRELQNTLYIFHKNVGVLILLLVVARLAARAAGPATPLPDALPAWQHRAAAISHAALYILLVVMAVSGYMFHPG